MTNSTNLCSVIERWQHDDIKLLPPVRDVEVIGKLSQAGHLLSRDVVELYCATGGMVGDEMDEKGLSLWSLERTVKENANHLSPYLLFADFLIDSHFYGLKYESPQESSVYAYYFADMEPQRVANSLDEFFYFHINDPSKLGLMGES